jgi:mRNA interferase HigB
VRIIKARTVYTICLIDKFRPAADSLEAWLYEAMQADWASPADVKAQYRNASIVNSKRVVFNIKGNEFRLVVDIEYRLRLVFVIWFGTHRDYEGQNIKKLSYGNQGY